MWVKFSHCLCFWDQRLIYFAVVETIYAFISAVTSLFLYALLSMVDCAKEDITNVQLIFFFALRWPLSWFLAYDFKVFPIFFSELRLKKNGYLILTFRNRWVFIIDARRWCWCFADENTMNHFFFHKCDRCLKPSKNPSVVDFLQCFKGLEGKHV